MKEILTSDQVNELFADDEKMYDLQFESGYCNYELTAGEIESLLFIRGKYSIADYLGKLYRNALIESGLNNSDDKAIRIDFWEASRAMNDDCQGMGKAVMLSDDSALQALLFMNYIEDAGEENEENY